MPYVDFIYVIELTYFVCLRTAVELFLSDPTFNNVYKRGHTNLAGYVLGLAFGYLVYHLQKTNFDASKYKVRGTFCFLALVRYTGVIFSGLKEFESVYFPIRKIFINCYKYVLISIFHI